MSDDPVLSRHRIEISFKDLDDIIVREILALNVAQGRMGVILTRNYVTDPIAVP